MLCSASLVIEAVAHLVLAHLVRECDREGDRLVGVVVRLVGVVGVFVRPSITTCREAVEHFREGDRNCRDLKSHTIQLTFKEWAGQR